MICIKYSQGERALMLTDAIKEILQVPIILLIIARGSSLKRDQQPQESLKSSEFSSQEGPVQVRRPQWLKFRQNTHS